MKPTIAEITNAVAEAFSVRVDNITGPRRHAEYSRPRFIVYAIAQEAGYSYPAIGARLGCRDHTTVIEGVKRLAVLSARDAGYCGKYEKLRDMLIGNLVNYQNWKFKSIRSAAQ